MSRNRSNAVLQQPLDFELHGREGASSVLQAIGKLASETTPSKTVPLSKEELAALATIEEANRQMVRTIFARTILVPRVWTGAFVGGLTNIQGQVKAAKTAVQQLKDPSKLKPTDYTGQAQQALGQARQVGQQLTSSSGRVRALGAEQPTVSGGQQVVAALRKVVPGDWQGLFELLKGFAGSLTQGAKAVSDLAVTLKDWLVRAVVKPLAVALQPLVKVALEQVGELILEVVSWAGSGLLETIVGALNDIIPLIGTVVKGIQAASSAAGALMTKVVQLDFYHRSRDLLDQGHARDALEAVYVQEERRFHLQLSATARNTASFVANLCTDTAIVGDFGASAAAVKPIVAVVNALIAIFETLYRFGAAIYEAILGNIALLRGELDGLFTKCPVLGSYYLASAGDSALLKWDMRDKDWMKKVEESKKRLNSSGLGKLGNSAVQAAQIQVYEHPFELVYYGNSEKFIEALKKKQDSVWEIIKFIILPGHSFGEVVYAGSRNHATFRAKTYLPPTTKVAMDLWKKVEKALKGEKPKSQVFKGFSSTDGPLSPSQMLQRKPSPPMK